MAIELRRDQNGIEFVTNFLKVIKRFDISHSMLSAEVYPAERKHFDKIATFEKNENETWQAESFLENIGYDRAASVLKSLVAQRMAAQERKKKLDENRTLHTFSDYDDMCEFINDLNEKGAKFGTDWENDDGEFCFYEYHNN